MERTEGQDRSLTKSLESSAIGVDPLDWIVLTAANRGQARAYETQLRAPERAETRRASRNWLVVADPRGRRAGSGGSTLVVLNEIARRLARKAPKTRSLVELFKGRRILIIHSGGDSRRLPAYAAQGKVFAPLPGERDGAGCGLFDHILRDLLAVPLAKEGRALIASGDVYLGVGRHQPDVNRPGVVGVACPGSPEQGARHGVYISGHSGKVAEFLQKPRRESAAGLRAIDADGRMLIDTGLVSLDPTSIGEWLRAAGAAIKSGRIVLKTGILDDLFAGRGDSIDLYLHMLAAIPRSASREVYLEQIERVAGEVKPEQRKVLSKVHEALHGSGFHVSLVPECEFVHIGSSREYLSMAAGEIKSSIVAEREIGTQVFNCAPLTVRSNTDEPSVVEACGCDVTLELGGCNIVVGLPKGLPGGLRAPIRMPRGWGLVALPIGKTDWTVVLFGDGDDQKTPLELGGTFGNRAIGEFVEARQFDPDDLWPSETSRTMWTARLWIIGPIEDVLRRTLWMMNDRAVLPPFWGKAARHSLEELLGRVNHERLIAHREEMRRLARVEHAARFVRADRWLPAERTARDLKGPVEVKRMVRGIERAMTWNADQIDKARLLRLAAVVREHHPRQVSSVKSVPAHRLDDEAFAHVAAAVSGDEVRSPVPARAVIAWDQTVRVTAPVRIDLSGGWSDTPPICLELGGCVVNAAITLDGGHPIEVVARRTRERVIRIASLDQGRSVTLTSTHEASEYSNPKDWAALAKAALALSGITPRKPSEKLERRLKEFGGGLELTMRSSVPKGSGLGTSSILGAAILACLDRVIGRESSVQATSDVASLIERASRLEQMLTTGGGWQDQVGGVTPGTKIVTTQPGLVQRPHVEPIAFDWGLRGPLAGRVLLYYTGYRRLARNILRTVVSRYLARDPQAISAIGRLKEGAMRMREAMGAGDGEAVARGLLDYWELKKTLDPGSTNGRIERLLLPNGKHLSGYSLTGAGGGGFLLMIARDERSAKRVIASLKREPPNAEARFCELRVDEAGLCVE